jgi:HlyD family secretion protein
MKFIPKELIDKVLESYLSNVTTRSRSVYWLIIIILLVSLGSLPFIFVDVAVRAGGYFQSDIERQTIYSPCNGKVLFNSILTGTRVAKGDTLMIIGSETLKAELAAISQKISENNNAMEDLGRLLSAKLVNSSISATPPVTKRYNAEFSNLARLIELHAQSYYRIRSDYQRKKNLHDQDIISDAEFEVSYFNFKSEEGNLKQVFTESMANWEMDIDLRRSDSILLQSELQKCLEDIRNRVVVAPTDGEIVQSNDIQNGTFVYGNQPVAEISPEGDLVAVCYVSPKDIGLIRQNLQVLIQVDALRYTEWGMLKAQITDISDDLIIDKEQSAYFRIKCKPERTYLSLKNGVKADLTKGMSLNARIVVSRRTLLNLLFDKTEDWINPYSN